MNSRIVLRGVNKQYSKNNLILRDFSLTISKGEFVFFMGPSGSGKSTLLKLLLKEEEVSSGTINVFGTDLPSMKKKDIPHYRRAIGTVFQDFRLIEKMTVFQNVAFPMIIAEAKDRDIRKRVPYVLGLFSIEDKANCYPRELSGGEKQRVGIARALVNNPNLIIADEPTGNIDPIMSYEIIELLSEINKRGTTVIVVTHDLSVVQKFPFRVVEVDNGIVRSDNKNEIISKNDPKLVTMQTII